MFPIALPRDGTLWRVLIAVLMFGAVHGAPAQAMDAPAHGAHALSHHLDVRLHPEQHAMAVQDTIQLPPVIKFAQPGVLLLRLARQAEVTSVQYEADGGALADVEYSRDSSRLRIQLPEGATNGTVTLNYRCVFNDPVDDAPANMDNPGFGVDGTIHPKGAMLLAGSGWHPISGMPGGDAYTLTIRAPKGMYAVTTGVLDGFADTDDESLSTWRNLTPHGPMPLAAGWWEIQEAQAGSIRVLTCFGKDNAALAPRYLEASSRWLRLYEALHGPYPFEQFLVVENFLPTGYGFQGFTLLGKTVIRLPFIPNTSLRHEIAHCWWGNGVFVDYSQGNWCEGLATYVADYLGQEEQSAEAGKHYRLRTLRRYALLAAGEEDFPLARFASRMSPASQAVGYGKAMFVFHMIRQRLGDDAFWGALRALYKEKLFQQAGWEDLRQAFVTHGRWDDAESRDFMDQWIARAGAPVLSLKEVTQKQQAGGWQLDGLLHQERPYYNLFVPMEMQVQGANAPTATGPDVPLRGITPFFLADMPLPLASVRFDPDAHVFRLLAPEEIPATVDTIKGSMGLTAILSQGMTAEQRKFLERGLQGLSQGRTRIVEETSLHDADLHALTHRDVLFFGQPRTPLGETLLGMAEPLAQWGVRLGEQGFAWPAKAAAAEADVLFLVDGAREDRGARAMLVVQADAPAQALTRPAALLTHYGRYSYLAFAKGRAVLKGTWPPGDGPLVHRFQPVTGE